MKSLYCFYYLLFSFIVMRDTSDNTSDKSDLQQIWDTIDQTKAYIARKSKQIAGITTRLADILEEKSSSDFLKTIKKKYPKQRGTFFDEKESKYIDSNAFWNPILKSDDDLWNNFLWKPLSLKEQTDLTNPNLDYDTYNKLNKILHKKEYSLIQTLLGLLYQQNATDYEGLLDDFSEKRNSLDEAVAHKTQQMKELLTWGQQEVYSNQDEIDIGGNKNAVHQAYREMKSGILAHQQKMSNEMIVSILENPVFDSFLKDLCQNPMVFAKCFAPLISWQEKSEYELLSAINNQNANERYNYLHCCPTR